MTEWFRQPLRLVPNNIRGRGGREIDKLRGISPATDAPDRSEAWIGSTTHVGNPPADNPYYGVYVNAEGRQNKCMEITKIQFIRTGGAFTENDGLIHAAVCLDHLDTCIFRENLIDDAGMFWYFADDLSRREEHIFETVSLYVRGNENCIADNVIRNSHADSIHLYGDGNILMNNIADRDVVIEGNGNTVMNLVLTGPEAKLVIRGEGNRVCNVPEDRILKV